MDPRRSSTPFLAHLSNPIPPPTSNLLNQLDADPADLSLNLSHLEIADRSLIALTDLQKEVGDITAALQKEMQLKETIAARKLAVYESQTSLLKAENARLQELVSGKQTVTRRLESANVELGRRVEELSGRLEDVERDKEGLRERSEDAERQAEEWERGVKEGQVRLQQSTAELSVLKQKVHEQSERIEELEMNIQAEVAEREAVSRNYKQKLKEAEETVGRYQKECSNLQQQYTYEKSKVHQLEEQLRNLEERDKAHDDLVSQLAQLATIANRKNSKATQ
ncbi:hypothetical protein HDV05_008696 [Chytridiales sp. JEL 0842]|nr:hypothetical protein HDV05_008696 [Chytridiales sp. JEL 0842]